MIRGDSPVLVKCPRVRELDGGEGQNRTVDTTIFSRMLYQLSYLATPEGSRAAQAGTLCPRETVIIARRFPGKEQRLNVQDYGFDGGGEPRRVLPARRSSQRWCSAARFCRRQSGSSSAHLEHLRT